jgi:tetratricopeptide (TPR) repeat protein
MMSRTTLYKGVYFGMVGAAVIAAGAVLVLARASPIAIVTLVACMLIPGRLLGYFWRDLLRGLRLFNARQFAESKRHSARFLAEVRRKPWLKHLIWLGSGSYSRDPEAMALNNLGGAESSLGEFDQARQHLEEAIAVDPKCPLPYHNMGVLLKRTGEADAAVWWFDEARRLGYGRRWSDRVVQSSQRIFATLDGAGRSRV